MGPAGHPSPHGYLLLSAKASENITLLRCLQAAHKVTYLQGMVITAHIHQPVPWSLPGPAVPLSKEGLTAIRYIRNETFRTGHLDVVR